MDFLQKFGIFLILNIAMAGAALRFGRRLAGDKIADQTLGTVVMFYGLIVLCCAVTGFSGHISIVWFLVAAAGLLFVSGLFSGPGRIHEAPVSLRSLPVCFFLSFRSWLSPE